MSAASNEDQPGDSSQTMSQSTVRTIKIVEGRMDSSDLFIGTREIIIGHGEDLYRLRLTAQNKLILTK
jgi:hemin uptake protein HemP